MIRQLSVFIENKAGSLLAVTGALKELGVNIRAISAFDTREFGILRMVVDQPQKAKDYLTSKGFVVRITKVIAVELKDERGNLNDMLCTLQEEKINIDYIYSFVVRRGQVPVMVFHTSDSEKAIAILKGQGITVVEESQL